MATIFTNGKQSVASKVCSFRPRPNPYHRKLNSSQTNEYLWYSIRARRLAFLAPPSLNWIYLGYLVPLAPLTPRQTGSPRHPGWYIQAYGRSLGGLLLHGRDLAHVSHFGRPYAEVPMTSLQAQSLPPRRTYLGYCGMPQFYKIVHKSAVCTH